MNPGVLSRLRKLAAVAANLLTLGCLLGALYWGHKSHWSFSHPKETVAHRSTAVADKNRPSTESPNHPVATNGVTDDLPGPLRAVEFRSPEEARKAGLEVGKAELREMSEFVTANGIVTYDQDHLAQLSARAQGIVWKVQKKIGQTVHKGEVMAILDSGEVGRAKAGLLQAMVHYDLTVRNLERLKAIMGSVPERTLRQAEAEVREDRVQRFNAQQTLVNLGLPINLADCERLTDEELAAKMHFLGLPASISDSLDPSTTTANLIPLVAPFDGVVISREIVVGEVVDPSRAQFTIADVRTMWLILNVDREDAPRIDIGQEVTFHADGMPREVTSEVNWISTEVDRKTRTVQVRAVVDNPSLDDGPDATDGQRLLRANMFGTGRIQIKRRSGAVTVPRAAIHSSGSRKLVFVPRPDGRTFDPRLIQTGISRGGYTEVVEGLAPGDEVVTTGSYTLKSDLLGGGD
ncbi:MAG TPA: efflux RND transporter periplasmic adaptor subunit [Planctomycetaceae bacterium]|nr:efflux RND transporter periplasmic adaptor subunit [Planctomycetaceae bacterium]